MEKYAVSMRLQRVTTEYAYVLVPVTAAVVVEQEDGTRRLDPDKLTQQAVALGVERDVTWYQESVAIDVHPIQQAPDPEEVSFRPE